ncbi:MAG: Uncharacterised protein [Puniceicoccaceae bacterium MED-G32]|nr:MAG: Uncharacterised protein [Puniceicoccaceae bacterium MED-G32]
MFLININKWNKKADMQTYNIRGIKTKNIPKNKKMLEF